MGQAKRKKQPTRGTRKRTKPKPKPITVEPLELHVRLVGIQRRGEEIVGKETMIEGILAPSEFSKLPKLLKDGIAEHKAAAGMNATE